MFQYFSRTRSTPGRIIRLNYAIDMRYGVLHDVATKVRNGEAINLTAGHVNVIWQGDANAMVLRALGLHGAVSPLNVSGPETISIRVLAQAFGERLGKAPVFTGVEAADGWLVNTAAATRLFGPPSVPLAKLVDWTADWSAAACRASARTPITIPAMATTFRSSPNRRCRPRAGGCRRAGARGELEPARGGLADLPRPGPRLCGAHRCRPHRRHRRDAAAWRPLRLDQHGSGRRRLGAAAAWRRD